MSSVRPAIDKQLKPDDENENDLVCNLLQLAACGARLGCNEIRQPNNFTLHKLRYQINK